MAVLATIEATGTEIVSESVRVHPVAIIVSLSIYRVVVVGLTEGFEEVEAKPDGKLVHEYLSPVTAAAPIEIELPEQIALLAIIELREGNGLV